MAGYKKILKTAGRIMPISNLIMAVRDINQGRDSYANLAHQAYSTISTVLAVAYVSCALKAGDFSLESVINLKVPSEQRASSERVGDN